MTYSSPKKKYLYMTPCKVRSGCYLLLIWSNQHNIVNIVHQCDTFWKRHMIQISLNQVMTQGWRVHMSLSKAVKLYCWPCQLKANCFWSLWAGTKKKAFARSTAAYHVQENVFICSSKDITSSTDAANWESPHDYAFKSVSMVHVSSALAI